MRKRETNGNAIPEPDRFSEKYSSKVGEKFIVYTKDLKVENGVTCIPVYMAYYL